MMSLEVESVLHRTTLERATPESQGIASSALLQFVEALDTQINEIHSFMLLRHGYVVAEGWWSPYAPKLQHMLFSLSKSFTSTAVGMAIAEGCFSLDDPVLSFFPDEKPAEVNEHLAAMRVRHLLSMSTGHEVDTMISMGEREDGNWTKAFFEVPVVRAPGTHFLYNTGATYMLSAIVQKTTGFKLVNYLRPRLFEPLGIEHPRWQESPQRISTGGFGLNVKTEDIARFGQLYLQKGMWEGKRLISEAWIEEATSAQISNGDGGESEWTQGYGYQFWRCRHNAYRGDGAFGQYCVVMPEQDAVIAITSGVADMQKPMNLIWDILLPAMGSAPLAEDAASHKQLNEKLSGLNLAPVTGQKTSPMASSVSDRTYKVDENELSVETISLNFGKTGCALTVKTQAGVHTIPCGYGKWRKSKTTLFNEPWIRAAALIATSGAWTAENTFTMVIRRYTTPFFNTLVFQFNGDKMNVETRVNVDFAPLKPFVLTAQQV